jgi:hypothetical protein
MALTGSTNEQKIWNYLLAKIGNAYGAAGLMGNLYAESGLSPTNLQNTYEKKLGYTDESYTAAVDGGSYANFANDAAGYGLAQWTYKTRKAALLAYAKAAGKSVGDLETQLAFLLKELTESYKAVLSTLKAAKTVKAASDAVLTKFECPADQSDAAKTKRAGYGQTYYNKYAAATSSTSSTATAATTTGKTSAAAVLAVAVAQIGYKEKATNAQLDDATANAGSGNYTKYARDFDEKYPNWYNGKKNGYAWCDMFVDWCFLTAFGYNAALKLLCQPEKSAGAGCTYSLGYYKAKGQFHTSNPQPGDQIFFGNSTSDVSHTGIVEKVDGSKVHTIEGNTSDQVARRSYTLTDKTIVGYGRPAYDVVATTTTSTATATTATTSSTAAKTTTTTAVEAAQSFTKSLAGAYKTTAALNLRAGAGTNKAVLVVIPKGGTVHNYGYYTTVSGVKWLYVQYTVGGKTYTGFCANTYLTK